MAVQVGGTDIVPESKTWVCFFPHPSRLQVAVPSPLSVQECPNAGCLLSFLVIVFEQRLHLPWRMPLLSQVGASFFVRIYLCPSFCIASVFMPLQFAQVQWNVCIPCSVQVGSLVLSPSSHSWVCVASHPLRVQVAVPSSLSAQIWPKASILLWSVLLYSFYFYNGGFLCLFFHRLQLYL